MPSKVLQYVRAEYPTLLTHRSILLKQEDVDWATTILYMDGGNKKRLLQFPGAIEKARCLGEFIGQSRIPDPNYLKGDPLIQVLSTIVLAAKTVGKCGVEI